MTNAELAKLIGCSKRQVSKSLKRAKSVIGLLRRGSALFDDFHGHLMLDGRKEVPPVVVAYLNHNNMLRKVGYAKYVAA